MTRNRRISKRRIGLLCRSISLRTANLRGSWFPNTWRSEWPCL